MSIAGCSPADQAFSDTASISQLIVSSAAAAKAAFHQRTCVDKVTSGSMSAGYDNSAARLPALLTAYRKYGSVAPGWAVRENHRCSIGAVAASRKNGKPTESASAPRSRVTGLAPVR